MLAQGVFTLPQAMHGGGYDQDDQLSGKPGNVRDFDSCQ